MATPQRTPVFDSLAKRGLDIRVIYLFARSPTANWGHVEVGHPHSFVTGTRWIDAGQMFVRVLRARRLRVLIVFGYRGRVTQAAILAARLARVQIVTRSDSNISAVTADGRFKRIARRLVLRVVFPATTRIWTIGTNNTRYWQEYVGLHNTRLIPYSVPVLPSSLGRPPAQRTSDPRHIRFLYVGRLIRTKDIDVLIEAFLQLNTAAQSEWSLDIVGDGPLLQELQALTHQDARIRFSGACAYDQLDRYYLNADVLVLPSRREAWGLVVNEALAFGLRVIVSEQVGANQLITRKSVGATFRVGDSMQLADAMRESTDHLDRIPVPQVDPTAAMQDDLAGVGTANDA